MHRFPSLRTLLALLWFASFLHAQVDRNQSGMSDVWEAAFGQGLAPGADLDGDGRTNREEAMAGTNPRDPRSVFQVTQISAPQPQTVRLQWPGIAGKSYQVRISTLQGQWENLGAPHYGTAGPMQRDLPLQTTYLTGHALHTRWTGLPSNVGLAQLKSYANGTAPAAGVVRVDGTLTQVETAQTNPDQSNYGQWIRGWLVPPATGTYTFWCAGDDATEVFLSTNSDPANKGGTPFVSNNGSWTGFREWTKFVQQTASRTLQAGQSYYFEVFQREFTGGDHVSLAWTGPGLDPVREIVHGRYVARERRPLSELAGGRMMFRVEVADVDSDGDGVSDYEEILAGYDPHNATTVPRISDFLSITRQLDSLNTVTLGTPVARAYEATGAPGRFTVFRAGNINPITVHYTVSGTAESATDFMPLDGSIELPVGVNTATIDVVPLLDDLLEPAESVVVTLEPGAGYTLGNPNRATVMIDDSPDVLFVAQLRPAAGVLNSGGWGTAALRMAGNKVFAMFSLSYSGLGSAAAGAQLYITANPAGTGGGAVHSVNSGQVAGQRWEFPAAGGYSTEQIIQALESGTLWCRVASAAHPGGEIWARFTREEGWETMPEPLAPPDLPNDPITDAAAARFLTQATFGPTSASIDAVKSLGYAGWLENQFNLPATYHLPYFLSRRQEFLAADPNDDGWQTPRQEAWWQHALTAPDQLRQRMAFALSQILVISQIGPLDIEHEGTTRYYDMLLEHSFGNYRTLLERVTLSPMMGVYLSMMRNQKPNLVTGAEPDENYAREIMQLFSIGLSKMHPDGSLKLDGEGRPIPTYTQEDIVGLAHVFTGWGPHYDDANPPRWGNGSVANRNDWFRWGNDPIRPMSFYRDFHDTAPKTIFDGIHLPGIAPGQSVDVYGPASFQAALDAIFNHPNVGPFVARQLIQRFVSSNPSPGYVYRVTSVFNNNGSGVRGDLRATLRAVLMDFEARSMAPVVSNSFGKQREPVIRIAHLLRAFESPPYPGSDYYYLNMQYNLPQQAPLLSPSVFNFFQPGYIQPGRIAAAGLLAPEFQITSESTVISQVNRQHEAIHWGGLWTPKFRPGSTTEYFYVKPNFNPLVPLVKTNGGVHDPQTVLVDRLNVLLLHGRMSAGLRQAITSAYAALPSWFDYSSTSTYDRRVDRIAMAVYIICTSPEFAIQR